MDEARPTPIRATGSKPSASAEACAELESARRALDRARRESKEAECFKAQLLANVRHEIRTPMNAILGFTRLLMKERLTPDQSEKLRYVYDAGTRLLEIVENILDFSLLAAGEMQLRSTAFHLDSVLHDALETIRPAAIDKGLSVHCHTQATVPRWLLGDAARLRQVLANLLNNAVKFTEHGSIHVQTTLDEEAEDAVILRVAVTDTGIGIPIDRQGAIFDSFSQGDGSTTRRFDGLGLGLAIARQLVQLMEGDIGFRSQPDGGSTFWFTTTLRKHSCSAADEPAATDIGLNEDAPVPSGEPQEDGAPVRPAVARVLAADDDKLSRVLIEALLTRAGCVVDLAANGCEALALAQTVRYDLVLMDLQMPEMDGEEAIRKIRQIEADENRHVTIVALTADEDRQRCLRAGADHYLRKPFAPDAILDLIQRCVPGLPYTNASAEEGPASGSVARPVSKAPAAWLPRLSEAVNRRDFSALERLAGRVKQWAAGCGAKTLADQALRIQLAARAKEPQRAAAVVAQLRCTFGNEPTAASDSCKAAQP